MPEVLDLGTITDLNTEPDINPFVNSSVSSGTASDDVFGDMELVKKATRDAETAPSMWFVNFLDREVDGTAKLRRSKQDVEDYLAWATTVWWTNVANHPAVPQDESSESSAARTAYHAKAAAHHVKITPCCVVVSLN
ncbi:phycobilisome linker polypeptide [Diplodia corticola]|uniref:Phycobilisome linker polypeptide n=1 Tax=Diplodia corticola TaxID=236234 RepID=A0A1J9QJW6_9PEZI|nr:phycobilisome linker polypeptide [Diplodia corticola]OJD29166.1 phycobilisome linker polypeptide [Diplodia corticola]